MGVRERPCKVIWSKLTNALCTMTESREPDTKMQGNSKKTGSAILSVHKLEKLLDSNGENRSNVVAPLRGLHHLAHLPSMFEDLTFLSGLNRRKILIQAK